MLSKSQAFLAASSRAVRASRALSTSTKAGFSVVSADDGRPVSELTLVVNNAGSRYEQAPGAAHLLEKFVWRDTKLRSALRLTRESELLGGQLSSKLSHEKLEITARFLREDLPYFVEALGSVVGSTLFKPHEFAEDALPLARKEAALARADAKYVAIEAAHSAAFRRGLGNAVLIPSAVSVSLDAIKEHAQKAYTKANLTLYGRGVNSADLDTLATRAFGEVPTGTAAAAAQSAFFGGEVRIPSSGPEHVAVLAFPTAPSPTLEVLKYVLDNKPVKWSNGTGLLNALTANSSATIDVHHKTYSDASLFTVVVSGPEPAAVAQLTKEAAAVIKKVSASGVDAQAVQRAQNRAKFVRADAQTDFRLSEEWATVGNVEIQAGAKELLKVQPTLATVGHPYLLPHLDELF